MQKYNKGSALLSALFIMTLVAIAATAMGLRIQLDIYRTQLITTTDKMYLASQGAIFWAMDTLSNPKNKLDIVTKNGPIAYMPGNLQKMYPDMQIEGQLYDLQARFNLNSLSQKNAQIFFQNLLKQVLPGRSAKDNLALTQTIMDWIATYDPGKGKDSWLGFYLRQKPPYQTSHQPMSSVSELRLVQGINAKEYLALAPVVTVLPEKKSPLNIKTAPKALLMALSDKMTETQVTELLQTRQEQNYEQRVRQIMQTLNINNEDVGFKSNYFLAVAIVTHAELTLINYSILKKLPAGPEGKVQVSLISENLNAL